MGREIVNRAEEFRGRLAVVESQEELAVDSKQAYLSRSGISVEPEQTDLENEVRKGVKLENDADNKRGRSKRRKPS